MYQKHKLQEIGRIINRKDSEGNTPLHCAILQWSQVRPLPASKRLAHLTLSAFVGSKCRVIKQYFV